MEGSRVEEEISRKKRIYSKIVTDGFGVCLQMAYICRKF